MYSVDIEKDATLLYVIKIFILGRFPFGHNWPAQTSQPVNGMGHFEGIVTPNF